MQIYYINIIYLIYINILTFVKHRISTHLSIYLSIYCDKIHSIKTDGESILALSYSFKIFYRDIFNTCGLPSVLTRATYTPAGNSPRYTRLALL